VPGFVGPQVRHDNTVTWLAYWHDPVSQNQFKYVWLAANSTWKADADRQKYEKARDLKNHIDRIRCAFLTKSDSDITSAQPELLTGGRTA
jgi:DNA topoisomerase-1